MTYSYLNFHNYFLCFELLASNTIKNETRKQFKNLLGINFVNYSSKFLAYIKKHLGHTGTLTNVQNKFIKLSGFGVDITKYFLHWETGNDEKHFAPREVFQFFASF